MAAGYLCAVSRICPGTRPAGCRLCIRITVLQARRGRRQLAPGAFRRGPHALGPQGMEPRIGTRPCHPADVPAHVFPQAHTVPLIPARQIEGWGKAGSGHSHRTGRSLMPAGMDVSRPCIQLFSTHGLRLMSHTPGSRLQVIVKNAGQSFKSCILCPNLWHDGIHGHFVRGMHISTTGEERDGTHGTDSQAG